MLDAQSDRVRTAMQSLVADNVTAEVSVAFGNARVPFTLLKGPVTGEWLYRDRSRCYVDTDLLISPENEERAEHVLASMGFHAILGTGWEEPGVARNHRWARNGAFVELHVTFTGIGARPDLAWEILVEDAGTMSVRGQTVHILSLPARLLHVALHAAQHGPSFERPLRDLELACAAHGIDDWRTASALAARIGAVDAMSAGLLLTPEGDAIKRQLRLPDASDPEVILRAASASHVALGLARLARETPRERLRHLFRVLVPTPTFLRWWTPIASRGLLGLVLAYVWRYICLARGLPGGMRSFDSARRAGARVVPPG